uniref:Gf.ODC4 protein n=1 Tax=Grifola frondosa TaxID=5627 RepID=A0A0C6DRV2_GRIFR|nr:oxalate decarboxylase 4 [Grifola frondosa]
MISLSKAIACAVLFAHYASAAPAVSYSAATSSASVASSTSISASTSSSIVSVSSVTSSIASASTAASAPAASPTVPYASDDPNGILWGLNTDPDPQAIRGSLGATIMGPQNIAIDQQNPDLLAPPSTDAGSIQNAKWPFGLSHNRLQTGGWARQENIDVMPIAQSMAGVNMRLEAGAIRELHWHKTAEWSYVLNGSVQVSAVNADGQNFLATVSAGDLWYFPPGIPHSLQATADNPNGAEFLLVFDNGAFSEDSTFLVRHIYNLTLYGYSHGLQLTDWMAHVPKEVIAKNFQVNISAFDHIPGSELYIFPSCMSPSTIAGVALDYTPTAPPPDNAQAPEDPQGQVPSPFIFRMSQVSATQLSGGSVKVVDSTTFQVSTSIAVAEVTVEPGAMREMHWHPTQDEWTYYISGQGRVTVFGSSSNARTFNYEPGDVGFIPASFGHYVENTSNTTLRYLEIFNTDRFQDISLNQWLALTPPDLVKAHLQLDDETISHLSKTKPIVIGPQ